jgi:hypothetical protein
VTLQLSCLRRTIDRSGEDTHTREAILWRDEATVAANTLMVGPTGTGIPVHFDLPADALETTTHDQSRVSFGGLPPIYAAR